MTELKDGNHASYEDDYMPIDNGKTDFAVKKSSGSANLTGD